MNRSPSKNYERMKFIFALILCVTFVAAISWILSVQIFPGVIIAALVFTYLEGERLL
jgi:heme/copper-type cytochrome/quinol oxidase subunit 4